MEASVSPVGVSGLMVMFHVSHLSFSAGDIVYLHFVCIIMQVSYVVFYFSGSIPSLSPSPLRV